MAIGLSAFSAAAWAGEVLEVWGRFGPSFSSAALTTLPARGQGRKNCLNQLDLQSDAAYTLRLLDGGTTSYSLALSSGATYIRAWDDGEQFCGSSNTALYISVSGGNASVNYKGFIGGQ